MRTLAAVGSVVAALALPPVAAAATTFQISGGGDGHGVGMSQYGAYGYALHGESYQFILAHYYQGTALSTTDPNQIVRVLLAAGPASFSGATHADAKKLSPAITYSVRVLASGSLALYRGPKKVGQFGSPLTVTGPGPLELADHGLYRGALEFRPVAGAVQTVNAVGLEDYVRGVVSAEMPSSWPMQALEAQAVAARTYAITSNVAGDGYQLYPDTRSQMYLGVAAETPSTDAAIAATKGQIVTYDGNPAETFFFASSGGYTEDIQNVWLGAAPEPWLRGVPDPYDAAGGDPFHRWEERMSMAAAQAKLGSLVRGRLLGIKVTKHGVSPRVISAQVVGTGGRTDVTGPQLQSIFGLDSTYMMFTTISSSRGALPSGSSSGGAPHGTSGASSTGGAAAASLRRAIRRMRFGNAKAGFTPLSASPRGLHGDVFPAPSGARAEVQIGTENGWRTVRTIRLGVGGAYAVWLVRAGIYRLVYHHVAGPAVAVS